jgi:hypothetical protein
MSRSVAREFAPVDFGSFSIRTIRVIGVEPFVSFVSLRFEHHDEMAEFVFDVAGCCNGVGNLLSQQ